MYDIFAQSTTKFILKYCIVRYKIHTKIIHFEGTKVWYTKAMPVDWPSCQHM
jgi:hypothetical protein